MLFRSLASAALTVLAGVSMRAPLRPGPWYEPVLLFATLLLTGDTLFEETGWRGFALPRFPAGRSRLANTVILGVLLAGWHLPIAVSESAALVPYLLATIASAVVTNWVYYGGRESALLAWLYHTSANTAGQLVLPLLDAQHRVTFFWMLAAANTLAAAIVLVVPMIRRRAVDPPSARC